MDFLKVDWYMHPLIFAVGGIVSILRVKFPVGFCLRGSYEFCWLFICLTQFYYKNSTWWDRWIRQFVCSTCCTIFKGWGNHLQPLGPTTWWWFHGSCRWLTRLYHTQTSYEWKAITTTLNREAPHTWELESPSAARWVMPPSLTWIVGLGWEFIFAAFTSFLNWRM